MPEDPPDLIPARMLNEVVYCPRLFFLEHVQGEWDDNADTIHGKRVHRRVDARADALPEAAALPPEGKLHARSVTASSQAEGIIATVDLIEAEAGAVVPVDYKRGAAPDPARAPHGAWPADRVQVGAQALALRESGYRCDRAVIYYAASKTRVPVELTEDLIAEVRAAVTQARRITALREAPPPLIGSPKCPRCSLVGICLPDETNALRQALPEPPEDDPVKRERPAVRPTITPRDEKVPLYVQIQGARIGRSGECLEIRAPDGETSTVRLRETSHVCVFGSVQLTAAALADLCERDIGVSLFSYGGWHYGQVSGFSGKAALLRIAQFEAAASPERRLPLARAFIAGKILNCRTLVRRNAKEPPQEVLLQLRQLATKAMNADAEESLLGIEGTAARLYFEEFGELLRPQGDAFDWNGRNRRPPKDPVNALLSLAYALLCKDVRIALCAAGFDPMIGFYHRPRPGRPALALDLMEEFRPLIADSTVLLALNTEQLQPGHFVRAAGGVALTEAGRREFLAAYERRMTQKITHPLFAYEATYRRVLEIQARLLARALSGELPAYPGFRTR